MKSVSFLLLILLITNISCSKWYKSLKIRSDIKGLEAFVLKSEHITHGGPLGTNHIYGIMIWEKEGTRVEIKIKTVSYDLLNFRDNVLIYKNKNKGGRFEEDLRNYIRSELQNNDSIVIKNILGYIEKDKCIVLPPDIITIAHINPNHVTKSK
jgi:hypothetical protein